MIELSSVVPEPLKIYTKEVIAWTLVIIADLNLHSIFDGINKILVSLNITSLEKPMVSLLTVGIVFLTFLTALVKFIRFIKNPGISKQERSATQEQIDSLNSLIKKQEEALKEK